MEEKIYLLTSCLLKLPITDFNCNQIATKFVKKNGWKEGMDLQEATNDCLKFMAVNLAFKN